MVSNPFSLELYAHDLLRQRRDEALRQALISQLPHASIARPDLVVRQQLAHRLRSLAGRLDPAGEPRLAAASSR